MDTHDVGRGRGGWREALATVRVPALVVSIDTDVLYPPVEQEELAAALPRGAARHARLAPRARRVPDRGRGHERARGPASGRDVESGSGREEGTWVA